MDQVSAFELEQFVGHGGRRVRGSANFSFRVGVMAQDVAGMLQLSSAAVAYGPNSPYSKRQPNQPIGQAPVNILIFRDLQGLYWRLD